MPSWISPHIASLLHFVAPVAGAAWFGGQWGVGPWYAELSKPDWTPPNLFFGRHEIAFGLVDILALLVTIAAFVIAAWPANQWASLLFIPYLLWVGYASALNASIWIRNAPRA